MLLRSVRIIRVLPISLDAEKRFILSGIIKRRVSCGHSLAHARAKMAMTPASANAIGLPVGAAPPTEICRGADVEAEVEGVGVAVVLNVDSAAEVNVETAGVDTVAVEAGTVTVGGGAITVEETG